MIADDSDVIYKFMHIAGVYLVIDQYGSLYYYSQVIRDRLSSLKKIEIPFSILRFCYIYKNRITMLTYDNTVIRMIIIDPLLEALKYKIEIVASNVYGVLNKKDKFKLLEDPNEHVINDVSTYNSRTKTITWNHFKNTEIVKLDTLKSTKINLFDVGRKLKYSQEIDISNIVAKKIILLGAAYLSCVLLDVNGKVYYTDNVHIQQIHENVDDFIFIFNRGIIFLLKDGQIEYIGLSINSDDDSHVYEHTENCIFKDLSCYYIEESQQIKSARKV